MKFIVFRIRSDVFSEYYHEISRKCHEQNSGHSKIIRSSHDSTVKYKETQARVRNNISFR